MIQPGCLGNVLFCIGAFIFIIGGYIPGAVLAGVGIYICIAND